MMLPSAEQMINALRLSRCSIFEKALLTRTTENSEVTSFPVLEFAELVQNAFGDQLLAANMQVGVHFINVNGPRPDNLPMHYHVSPVVGCVVRGSGSLFHEVEGAEQCRQINAGDIFVFPLKVNHLLACTEGEECHCLSFEFGPALDYQRHHKS